MSTCQVLPAEKLTPELLAKGVVLDVRTKMEHGEKRLNVPHAHVPLDELNPDDFMKRHGLDASAPVYILCRSGKRATQAAEKFMAAGYTNVHVIDGGIIACEGCGHAVTGDVVVTQADGKSGPITLERQVRIAAGAFVALGAMLALTVHPLFLLLPLFVGGGLIFAGVTDRCGLALVLTKAPWNQRKALACGTSCGTSAGQGCR